MLYRNNTEELPFGKITLEMSVLPKNIQSTAPVFVRETLTHPALHLQCRNCKNRRDFYYHLDHDGHHFGSRRDLYVDSEASEKVFNAQIYR